MGPTELELHRAPTRTDLDALDLADSLGELTQAKQRVEERLAAALGLSVVERDALTAAAMGRTVAPGRTLTGLVDRGLMRRREDGGGLTDAGAVLADQVEAIRIRMVADLVHTIGPENSRTLHGIVRQLIGALPLPAPAA